VSGAALPAARPIPAREGRSSDLDDSSSATAPVALLIELPLFAALAAFGMALWARLVEPSSADRELLALGVVCLAAVLLTALGRAARPGFARSLAAAIVAIAGLAIALLAAGLPADLLAPAHWGELREHVRGGVGGIESARIPYDGADEWIRLSLVLGAPALVAVAGALAFWPARRRGVLRAAALGVLLTTYGVAATLDNPGAEALWGIVLLLLSAAWLWIPRLERRGRTPAVTATLAAGVLALPLTANLNGEAWWDYENWSWFGAERSVSFQWNHEYGPLDWPREGTTLMTVETENPLYWKASVLDRFDGYVWQRAAVGDPAAAAERQGRGAAPGSPALLRRHPGWITEADFELQALTSDLVVGAGTTLVVDDAGRTLASPDGTLTHLGEPLERGERYSIVSYAPRPTPAQLERAPAPESERRFAASTLLSLPPDSISEPLAPAISMPLWGERDPEVNALLEASPYAGTYRLARRLTAGADTPYDAVRAIEAHLRRGYTYTPTVPERTYPLASFLFDDQTGYCQQFAGSMGLMLRMVGIPTRVVSGFAPGTRDSDSGLYEVRDYDAHSWVEIYFRGIGWVTFDPTPAAAPAGSQRLGGEFATAFRGPGPNPAVADTPGGFRRGGIQGGELGSAADRGPGVWGWLGLAALAALALAATAVATLAWGRRRALLSGTRTDAQVAELGAALRRLGWDLGPRDTLLVIERRAIGRGRAALPRYVAALREHRYGSTAAPPPGPEERRALRRSLAAGSLRRRWRAWLAIPPGGPAGP